MTDAADRLAQAIRDVINEAVRAAAVRQERPTLTPARAVETPEIPQDDLVGVNEVGAAEWVRD
jgi:hypothetical protein